MTPKERVKQRFPTAYSLRGLVTGCWGIFAKAGGEYYDLGHGITPREAWASAAISKFVKASETQGPPESE